ncbi:UBX domain-containing protein [Operophtera brumata]|uniref:UBX domain-containing protein n=1 Tax=Operophtera brumata TaxID=104452 RepID=A0A0L7LJY2_OPEBR|nr:UBX domain-containing protein [Operophtera brumata]
MDLEDNAMGLSQEQTDKILQFQDLTGIDDMSICRDVLQRHQWDLEVAIQEQLNIREGRPSVFATEARAPPVVHDHIAQHVFTDEPPEGPGGMRGLLSYVVNLVVSVCYNTFSSVFNLLLSFLRNDDRRLVTDPLGDVMNFINSYSAKYNPHPVFYQGTYAQALNDAKNELRFLIVYLHSESATETQNFCRVEREVNQRLRLSQDEAYAESLAADQEKERRRAAERCLQQQRDDAVQQLKQQEERRKQDVVEARAQTAARLPPEPAPGAGTLALLIRLPCGERLTRSHPQSPEEFEITTNFPKRVLARGAGSILDVGLQDRDVLFVNDVNA